MDAQREERGAGDVEPPGGDLQVTGDPLRTEQGFLITLELREAQSGRLAVTSSAPASTRGSR